MVQQCGRRAWSNGALILTLILWTFAGGAWANETPLDALQDEAVTIEDAGWIAEPAGFETPVSYTVASTAPRIDLVRFIVPSDVHPGNPWSHWGRALLHSSGRHYVVQGSHTAMDGNAYIFEYDPETRVNRAVAHLHQPFAPWPSGIDARERTGEGGAFGFGKVHGRLSEAKDGTVYFASYYGHAKRGSEWFYGDRIFKFEPATGAVTDLGRPHKGFGYPATHFSAEHGLLYMEAFERKAVAWGDPERNYRNPNYDDGDDDYHIQFMAYDVNTGETVFIGDHPHTYGRDMFVDRDGNAYYNHVDGTLRKYDPESNSVTDLDVRMPGNNIRRTAIDRHGMMYGALLDTRELFAFDAEKPAIRRIASLMGDAASLAVAPDGRYAYYVPGSHGILDGGPLVQVNLQTGDQKIIAFLEEMIHEHTGLYLGGSLSGVVAADGRTLYYTLHAGADPGLRYEDELLLVIHVPESEIGD